MVVALLCLGIRPYIVNFTHTSLVHHRLETLTRVNTTAHKQHDNYASYLDSY
jgi:hypothetical protein